MKELSPKDESRRDNRRRGDTNRGDTSRKPWRQPLRQINRPAEKPKKAAAAGPRALSGSAASELHAQPPVALQSLKVSDDCARALEALPGIFDEVVPLNQKHRQELGQTIRSLWEDLTSEREHRAAEYLSSPAYYSAYVRYFLPWNIVRLSAIFADLPLSLDDSATIVDIGSGPLTIPIALYVARPDLRAKPLTLYCTDKTERILKVGQTVFESLCVRMTGSLPPWKIILSKQQFGSHISEKADLLTAANVFNEFFWKGKTPLGMRATLTARQLLGYLKGSGSIFLMEPGDPRSGSFISAIRAALASFGAEPKAPCPHSRACPMPGIFRSLETPGGDQNSGAETKALDQVIMPKRREKYPWCHFTMSAKSAPGWMKTLSDEAGLPKEKLVFSYLLSSTSSEVVSAAASILPLIRIISEEFPLPDYKAGRYSCSAEGYCLVRYSPLRSSFSSGDLLRLPETVRCDSPAKESTAQGKESPSNPRSHFADRLEGRFSAAPKALVKNANKGMDIDEKSGAIIVSY